MSSEQAEDHWEWSEEFQAFFRQWTDEAGELQYEWRTPRTEAEIDPAFQGLSLNDSPEILEPAYTHTPSEATYYPSTVSQPGDGYSAYDEREQDYSAHAGSRPYGDGGRYSQPQGGRNIAQAPRDKGKGKAHDTKSSSKHTDSKRSGKEKERQVDKKDPGKKSKKVKEPQEPITGDEQKDPFYSKPRGQAEPLRRDYTRHDDHHHASRPTKESSQWPPPSSTGEAFNEAPGTIDPSYATEDSTTLAYPDNPYAGTEVYGYDEQDLQAVMTESSRAAFLGPANAGGPSTEGDYEEVEVPYEDGRLTPTQADPYPPILKIKGAEGKSEPLDKRFRVERSSKFAPGLVIKILWSEPRSENSKTLNTYTEVGQEHMFGKLVYVGLRRFIVVATDKGHSTCVPIYTYIGKGCKKRGVKPDKHGIIYDIKSKPQMLHGEPELGFVPVGMRIEASGERLARESRVDYSKLVNVEHNVRVFIIGRIDGKHVETVKNAVDTCWNLKISAMG